MTTEERIEVIRKIAGEIVLMALQLKGQEHGTQTFIAALALASGGFIGEMATPDGLENVLQLFTRDVVNLAAMASERQLSLKGQEPTIQ